MLSRLAREVISIERYRTLADRRGAAPALGFANVEVVAGDGLAGLPDHAPFDRIIVTAAAERCRRRCSTQLADEAASC